MNNDIRNQLQQAYTFIKADQKQRAIQILKPILQQQPNLAEAWWLAANASSNPKDTAAACQRVLTLKPDYQPARQMLIESRLSEAAALVEQQKRPEARTVLQVVLDQNPECVPAWTMLADIAPSPVDAAAAYRKILALQPENIAAQQKLLALNQQSVQKLAAKHRVTEQYPVVRRRRPWLAIGLVALLAIFLTIGGLVIYFTGQTLGLPIGSFFNSETDLAEPAARPVVKTGSIVVGSNATYRFNGHAGKELMISVSFGAPSQGDPKVLAKAIRFTGPDGKIVALAEVSTIGLRNVAFLRANLTKTGLHSLSINGVSGVSQGPYTLQIVSLSDLPDSGDFDFASIFGGNSITGGISP